MTLTDYICQEKKEEEDTSIKDIVHQYVDMNITLKRAKKTSYKTGKRKINRTTITRKQQWEDKQLYEYSNQ